MDHRIVIAKCMWVHKSCAIKPKTEELLHILFWSIDQVLRPTFRNLNGSFESWAYQNGLLMQLHRLEREKWIERKQALPADRLYRLTGRARLHVLGGRDPEQEWRRSWDGEWRMVLFDVPMKQNRHRLRLRRYLHRRGFGYLQNSVWITPDPLDKEMGILSGSKIDVESLILLKARPCAGETDAQIVAGAWDFERINHGYAQYLEVLNQRPPGSLRNNVAARALRQWAAHERGAWRRAIARDPLLPSRLLPRHYLGCAAWKKRATALRAAGRQARSFVG